MATQAGLAGLVSTYASFGLRLDYLADHAARLARATRDDVARVAAQYLGPAGAVTVILGDADQIESSVAAITPLVRVPVDPSEPVVSSAPGKSSAPGESSGPGESSAPGVLT
jgi:zinc protease